tara:strand:+ start:454 stop:1380 length:927 start_codon:yes stop_codon:yes gene_type:complete
MKIAFLGSSSQIAKGLLRESQNEDKHHFYLFTRDTESFYNWMDNAKLNSINIKLESLKSFNSSHEFDLIINFVGIGDPGKALKMGSKIFDITYKYDQLVIDYLAFHPNTKYIFISSGVVYGDIFKSPASSSSSSVIHINDLKHTDWYSMSKIYAESRHRALEKFSIVDVRVFNYVSSDIDTNSRFLITDALRSIKENQIMKTDNKNVTRDYIGPEDLYQLIMKLSENELLNTSVDCFTKDPTDKFSILEHMKSHFGLKYEIINSNTGINAYGSRENYFSENYKANSFGYEPSFSSLENIVMASEVLLR